MSDTLIEPPPSPPPEARLAAPPSPLPDMSSFDDQSILKRILSILKAIPRNMFGMDHRSLALLRIAIALVALWVVYTHGMAMRIFYTDHGVLTRFALFNGSWGDTHAFSLHFAHGSTTYIACLFALQGILGLMMLVGYHTRFATIGTFILILSLQNRHPVVIYGADNVLRVSLFWMMFMPLGGRYSIDRLTGRVPAPPEKPYLGIAGIAFFLQFASIYFFGALMKTGDSWQVNHDAVAYTLAIDAYTRPMGHWIAQYPAITKALTISTMYLETYGPLLFILPIFSKWGRMLGFLMFAGLQMGFNMCMFLEYFGPVMIAISMVFLPAMFWDRIARPAAAFLTRIPPKWTLPGWNRVRAWMTQWVTRQRARNALRMPVPALIRWPVIISRDVAVAVLMCLTLMWNHDNLSSHWQKWRTGGRDWLAARGLQKNWNFYTTVSDTMVATGLQQNWDMFSPNPQNIDGWFMVVGTMRDGRQVNLITGEMPASWEKPRDMPLTYRDRLWMGYLISFWTEGDSSPEAFTYYLGQEWNGSHEGDEKLTSVTIDKMVQWIGPGPDKKSEVIKERVFEEIFW